VSAADFPPGWQVHRSDGGTSFASRYPFRPTDRLVTPEIGVGRGITRYAVDTPAGPVTVVNVHMPTPRPGLAALLAREPTAVEQVRAVVARRDAASRQVREWVGPPTGGVIVAGDFNAPPESAFFRRDWGAFGNAFSDAGNGWGLTKFTRLHGVRIDHILYAPPWRCVRAWVGPNAGSDHRPVVAELVLGGAP
jgi:endonuclease/exonuclease/phosphatase (EEP) superfamily protein YafD